MRKKEEIESILSIILGKEDYEKFINEAEKEYKGKVDIKDFGDILHTYFIAIFLIGISKKAIELYRYKIRPSKNLDIEIKTEPFCKKYSKYIEKIEDFKFDLLRELLYFVGQYDINKNLIIL